MEMYTKIYVFTNAKAGNNERAVNLGNEITNAYRHSGMLTAHYISENSVNEVATKLLEAIYSPEKKRIIIVGGDGTNQDIINVIAPYFIKDKEMRDRNGISFLPGGSGNDYFRMLGIDFEAQLVDVMKVCDEDNTRFATNSVSLGFDAVVASKAEIEKMAAQEANDPKRSKNCYNKAIWQTIRKNPSLTLGKGSYIDQEDKEIDIEWNNLTLISLFKGEYYGGGKRMGIGAYPTNGLMKLVYAKKLNHIQLLWLLVMLLRERHLNSGCVRHDFVKNLKLYPSADTVTNYCLDGNMYHTKSSLEVSVVPQALCVDNCFKQSPEEVQKILRYYLENNN